MSYVHARGIALLIGQGKTPQPIIKRGLSTLERCDTVIGGQLFDRREMWVQGIPEPAVTAAMRKKVGRVPGLHEQAGRVLAEIVAIVWERQQTRVCPPKHARPANRRFQE
jgi:hypothetical protein